MCRKERKKLKKFSQGKLKERAFGYWKQVMPILIDENLKEERRYNNISDKFRYVKQFPSAINLTFD